MDDRTDDTLDTAERRHLDTNDIGYDFFYSNHQTTHRKTSTQETGAGIEPACPGHYFIVQATYYYNIYTHIGIISDAHRDLRSVPYRVKGADTVYTYIHTRHGPGALLSKTSQPTDDIYFNVHKQRDARLWEDGERFVGFTHQPVVVFTHPRTPIHAFTHS